MKTVLLADGTVGSAPAKAVVGDVVTVRLHDENGNSITATGAVVEVLADDSDDVRPLDEIERTGA